MRNLSMAVFLMGTLLCSTTAGVPSKPMSASNTRWVRERTAEDFYSLINFYIAQQTPCACSLASVVMALNFFIGPPPIPGRTILTQDDVLKTVYTDGFEKRIICSNVPAGVTFDELLMLTNRGLDVYNLSSATGSSSHSHITATGLRMTSNDQLKELIDVLKKNEDNGNKDMMLAYLEQGTLTGDDGGKHVSPVGAFDYETNQVLVLDVDRQWYVPYWVPVDQFLSSLINGDGGLIWLQADTLPLKIDMTS